MKFDTIRYQNKAILYRDEAFKLNQDVIVHGHPVVVDCRGTVKEVKEDENGSNHVYFISVILIDENDPFVFTCKSEYMFGI